MINLAQDPLANPADMTDPENQHKTAANVLSQLGLHPDQMGARNLLDNHFQGMTAHPDVKALIEPRNGVSPTDHCPSLRPPRSSSAGSNTQCTWTFWHSDHESSHSPDRG